MWCPAQNESTHDGRRKRKTSIARRIERLASSRPAANQGRFERALLLPGYLPYRGRTQLRTTPPKRKSPGRFQSGQKVGGRPWRKGEWLLGPAPELKFQKRRCEGHNAGVPPEFVSLSIARGLAPMVAPRCLDATGSSFSARTPRRAAPWNRRQPKRLPNVALISADRFPHHLQNRAHIVAREHRTKLDNRRPPTRNSSPLATTGPAIQSSRRSSLARTSRGRFDMRWRSMKFIAVSPSKSCRATNSLNSKRSATPRRA